MIDTDKYEGHTEGPWRWNGDDITVEPHILFYSHITRKQADGHLAADAPLLLAEVKRLRGLLHQVADEYTDADGVTYEIYCEFGEDEEE